MEWLNTEDDGYVSDSSADSDSDTHARQNFDERGDDSRSESSQSTQSDDDGSL